MTCSGAENETRTRDPNLGKVVLYQLSYFRKFPKWDCKGTHFCGNSKFFFKFSSISPLLHIKWAISLCNLYPVHLHPPAVIPAGCSVAEESELSSDPLAAPAYETIPRTSLYPLLSICAVPEGGGEIRNVAFPFPRFHLDSEENVCGEVFQRCYRRNS